MPRIPQDDQARSDTHKHIWRDDWLPAQKICREAIKTWKGGEAQCGCLLISQIEKEMRESAWNNYAELVRTTESFRDFIASREAYKQGDKTIISSIVDRAKKRLQDEEYLPKPEFPDPVTWNKYIVTINSEGLGQLGF